MKRAKILATFSLFCVSLLGFLVVGIVTYGPYEVRVAFLNVGQGDSVLISCGSQQVLIDTGRGGDTLLSELGRHMPPWDRDIEIVLLTHPDADHIGALPALLSKYRVGLVLSGEIPNSTGVGRAVHESMVKYALRSQAPFSGMHVSFGRGGQASLRILFPHRGDALDPKRTNDSSVVSVLQTGSDTFLFTGDLAREENHFSVPDVRVLKVAHHGSKHSTSELFLAAARPEEAVISVGKNSYGHPAEEVLSRLVQHGTRVFRTDSEGTIVYRCPISLESRCTVSTHPSGFR